MNDKTKHTAVGAVIGLLSLPLSALTGLWWAYLISFAIGTFFFFLKEETDKYDIDLWFYKHKATGFDKMDLAADYLGLFAGFIVSFIVYYSIQIIKL